MNKTCKKSIALLLVILQLVVLLPVTAVRTKAVDPEPAATETPAPQPVLNKVIRGTVQFGTFNFTGAVGSREAADYVMPFLYTDDYFATSAIQPNVTGKEMSWKALENKSLATASLDFTMACFGSNEEITSEADYDTEYDKNGRAFLEACDFKYVESNNYTYDGSNLLTKENQYNKFPSKDSIGVIVGSKDITVWTGEQNETFKLVAIGVRGAGYGAEWASNFTLGASGEHQGFREAADKVEYKLEDYLEQRPSLSNLLSAAAKQKRIVDNFPNAYRVIGAVLAGADAETVARLEEAAGCIGMAFQIQDDILDVTASESELGKPIGSDAANGKVTWLTHYGMERSVRDVRSFTDRALEIIRGIGDHPFLEELLVYLIDRKS